jgi:hexokinase
METLAICTELFSGKHHHFLQTFLKAESSAYLTVMPWAAVILETEQPFETKNTLLHFHGELFELSHDHCSKVSKELTDIITSPYLLQLRELP